MAESPPLFASLVRRANVRCIALALVVAASTTAGAADPQKPRATSLMQDHKCYVCHGDSEPGAGPAFVDVAAYYRGTPGAVDAVAASIRRGVHSAGPWNMPPHPELSTSDARIIARYIVSLHHPRERAREVVPGLQTHGAAAKGG